MNEARASDSARLLVAEDDRLTADLVASYLRREGYRVAVTHDGDEAARRIRSERFDLLLLDVMLPGTSGLELCRLARSTAPVPVILLTARTTEDHRVEGLDLGADDYVTKPFLPRELMARVRAVLRRSTLGGGARCVIGPLTLDSARRAAAIRGQDVALTATEFRLLERLVSSPERVHVRSSLLDALPDGGRDSLDRTVDVHVRNLRRKFEPLLQPGEGVIDTVVGVGYRIAAALREAR